MKLSETAIASLYEESCKEVKEKLSTPRIVEGRLKSANLGGWIFEQAIRYCLSQELRALGLSLKMQDRISLGGRAKIDLLVGRVAVELKAGGSFGACDEKYAGYRRAIEGKKWVYFYLTLQEGHAPYRKSTKTCFGAEHTFFQDTPKDWKRFVNAIIANQA